MVGCGKRKWNSSNNKRGRVGGYVCGKRMLCPECYINLKLKDVYIAKEEAHEQ